LIAQHTEKAGDFSIEVVIGLERSGGTIQEDSRGASEWLAIMVAIWKQQGQEPIEVAILATIPAKRELPARSLLRRPFFHRSYRKQEASIPVSVVWRPDGNRGRKPSHPHAPVLISHIV
jgi:hypothetical protein